jgi:glycosyltransferase involved in cell wall biosynthesis
MAAGLPVAAYAIDGVTELVADRETGRTVPPGDAPALADVLAEMVAAPEDARALGAAGRELVAARFGFDALVDGLLQLYAGAAAR